MEFTTVVRYYLINQRHYPVLYPVLFESLEKAQEVQRSLSGFTIKTMEYLMATVDIPNIVLEALPEIDTKEYTIMDIA